MVAHSKPRRFPRIILPKGVLIAWQEKAWHIVSRTGTVDLGRPIRLDA